jgi:hypothetical protein
MGEIMESVEKTKALITLDLREIPVYYINLSSEIEKNTHMQKMLLGLGFKNINRIEAVLDYQNGSIARSGTSESHYKALNNIDPPFIVFEDDCEIFDFNPIINIPQETDAFYLGNTIYGIKNSYIAYFLKYKKEDGFDNLYKIYNMLSGHAILYVSKRFVEIAKLCCKYSALELDVPQDIAIAEIQKLYNVYTPNKPMFYQKYYGYGSNKEWHTNKQLTDYEKHNNIFEGEHHFFDSL